MPMPACRRPAPRLPLLAGLLVAALACGACSARGESHGTVADTVERPFPPPVARPGETPRTGTQRGLVPPPLPAAPLPDWATLRGDGFTLRYPPEATLHPVTTFPDDLPATAIRGPVVVVRSADAHVGTHTGPAYQLMVASAPDPGVRPVARWVDSVRTARDRRARDAGDTLALHGPAVPMTVAGEQGLMLVPFCGDCEVVEVYLASGQRRVLVSMVYDLAIPGDRESQRRLYEAILGTFRWTP